MEKINVSGLRNLGFAVVDGMDTVVSLHQHPDAADRFLTVCARTDLRVVELLDPIGYVQR